MIAALMGTAAVAQTAPDANAPANTPPAAGGVLAGALASLIVSGAELSGLSAVGSAPPRRQSGNGSQDS